MIILFVNGEILNALVDLEDKKQKFVLQTKKITIPGYPDAFNPSIIDWNGNILMSFRARKPSSGEAVLVGLMWLDRNFSPNSPPMLLKIKGERVQDPRLFLLNGHLYIAYSDLIHTEQETLRRMFLAEIMYNGIHFLVSEPEFFLDFEADGNRKFEKNWVPFVYNDFLLFSYTISPHKVFLPLFGEGKCLTANFSQVSHMPWVWGDLRGGTPALMVGNQYLGFFHSTIEMRSIQSEGQEMPHYFMGAYTFSATPPFFLTKISPKPIIGLHFYEGEVHKTWKPLRVIFPGGFVFNDKHIWVAYGRQDHEVWVVKLDRKGLLDSLIPLDSIK